MHFLQERFQSIAEALWNSAKDFDARSQKIQLEGIKPVIRVIFPTLSTYELQSTLLIAGAHLVWTWGSVGVLVWPLLKPLCKIHVP